MALKLGSILKTLILFESTSNTMTYNLKNNPPSLFIGSKEVN